MPGVRIRLDLSDFVYRVESKRMMFLDTHMIRTISDLQDKIREEHSECDDRDLLMFLEDGFLLPSWEPIQILQPGDLIKVSLKQDLKSEQKKKRKRGLDESVELSSKKAKILPRVFSAKTKPAKSSSSIKAKEHEESSSDVSSDSTTENEENEAIKAKPVAAKVTLTKEKKAKDDSTSNTSDSSDESEDNKAAPVQKTVKKAATEKSDDSSSSSSSDSESNNDEPTKAKLSVQQKPVAKPSSSSESEDSDSDEEQTKQVPKVLNKPAATIAEKKTATWSDDSSSSSEEEVATTKAKIVPGNHKTKVDKAKESSSDDSSVGESSTNKTAVEPSANKANLNQESDTKKKRKRKRKNKNKNKLPPGEMSNFEMSAAVPTTSFVKKKKENSRIVFHDRAEETPDNQKDDDQNNDMEFTAEDIQRLYAMSKPATPIAKANTTANSIIPLVNTSSTPVTKANYNVSKPITPVEKSTNSANHNSSLTECEKSVLNSSNQNQSTPIYAKNKSQVVNKKNPFSFQPRVLTMNELKNGISKKTVDSTLVTANGDHKDTPDTNGHSKSGNKGYNYKAIDTSKDVYTNKSIIIRNPPKESNDINNPEEDIIDSTIDPTTISKVKDYEALERALVDTISVNDCIAFKMIEMSDSYTPELSGWKEGKVIAKDGSVITFQILSPVTKKKTGRFELNPEEELEEDPIIQLDTRDIMDPRSVNK